MKVAIVGSRNIDNLALLENIWHHIHLNYDHTIISGGAKGVDTNARQLAKKYKMDIVEYIPDWNKYGKSAGYKRNVDIIDACDMCICIWDGESKGTEHDIKLCTLSKTNHWVWNDKEKTLREYFHDTLRLF